MVIKLMQLMVLLLLLLVFIVLLLLMMMLLLLLVPSIVVCLLLSSPNLCGATCCRFGQLPHASCALVGIVLLVFIFILDVVVILVVVDVVVSIGFFCLLSSSWTHWSTAVTATRQWSVVRGPQNIFDIFVSSSVKKNWRPKCTNSLSDNWPSPFLSITANETAASSSESPRQRKKSLYCSRSRWPVWSKSTACTRETRRLIINSQRKIYSPRLAPRLP